MFWNSTHRKIVEVLEVDREVNNPKRKRKNAPAEKPKKQSEKISVAEALKRF
jgi:hypothetical protein